MIVLRVFCDITCWDAVTEFIFQDVSQNTFQNLFFMAILPFFFQKSSIFCTGPERKTNPPIPTEFWVTVCVPEPISLEK
jgi:hypothetical protein